MRLAGKPASSRDHAAGDDAMDGMGGRPAILGPVTVASFVLSVLNVIWVVVIGCVVVLVGLGSWLLGPAAGLVGTALAGIALLFLLAESLLSLLLFLAAWKNWGDDPSSLGLHKAWAWISLVIDLVILAFTGGLEPGAWFRLAYAIFLLYLMNREDVVDYFNRPTAALLHKPGRPSDWL